MNSPHRARPDEFYSSGEVAQLLQGLERQKEELGPIAEELLELLHRMGVNEPPPETPDLTPSNG
jgi:hypothetical protein